MTFFKLIFLAAVLLCFYNVRAVHASHVHHDASDHSRHLGGIIAPDFSIRQPGIRKCIKNHQLSNESHLGTSSSRHIVINEIMVDPSPPNTLPEAEFIEIFNASDQSVDLSGWTVGDPKSTATLPAVDIGSGQFIVLCKEGQESLFQPFGKVIGLANWPSLNNSGDQLILKTADSVIIDQVFYTDSFYRDPNKSKGGWSLEQINPFNLCPDGQNWQASESAAGGTPGKENTVIDAQPDLRGPEITSVFAENATRISLSFNERIKSSTLQPHLITVSPENQIDRIASGQVYSQKIRLWLKNAMQPNILHTLQVKNMTDCAGNLIREGKNVFQFALAAAADSMDILINEVLFNPRPGGKDFVEIYNASQNYINLKGWNIANAHPITQNPKVATIRDHQILTPGQYLVITEDIGILKADYPFGKEENYYEVQNMPALPDDTGNVTITDSLGQVIDSFDYFDHYHLNLLTDLNGVSLERISAKNPTNRSENWHSAAEAVGHATPGYQNSQKLLAGVVSDRIAIKPKIFHPNNDGVRDFAGIHYQFDQSGYLVSIFIYDIEGRKIKEIVNNDLSGTAGFYRWDGTNETKSLVDPGYYIILVDVLDPTGNSFQIKKTVVVAPGF